MFEGRKLYSMSVCFELVNHKGEDRIKVGFEYDSLLNKKMQTLAGAKRSHSLKCWHMPDTVENRLLCRLPSGNDVRQPQSVTIEETLLPNRYILYVQQTTMH